MTSGPSATFFGSGNGTGVVAGSSLDLAELKIPARPQHRPLLSREDPFGLTIIIGGTNVRFCISRPGDSEPLVDAIKWQDLKGGLSSHLESLGVEFGNSHSVLYPVLAKRFVEFLSQHFDPTLGPMPIEKLCALNFSIAGRVCGDERYVSGLVRPVHGIDAEVSTTNTGLNFCRSRIGRDFYEALKAEVPGMRLLPERVLVLNDARAGLEGEKILQNLPADQRVFFEICGTGDGSDYDVPGFNEIGHRTIFDSIENRTVVLVGDEIQQLIAADGSFKSLPEHQEYAENQLAGPWVAIRFVRSLLEKPAVMAALASRIFGALEARRAAAILRGEEDLPDVPPLPGLLASLYSLAEVKAKERTRWAVDSNSFLIREVNEVIFQPNHREIRRAIPCNYQIEPLEHSRPERALLSYAWSRQKSYFKDRGQFVGAVYRTMAEQGVQPHRYILGGGLGEMFNRYSADDREDALDLIVEHARLPAGIFDFSRVSPEAREAALAYQSAEIAKQEQESERLVCLGGR